MKTFVHTVWLAKPVITRAAVSGRAIATETEANTAAAASATQPAFASMHLSLSVHRAIGHVTEQDLIAAGRACRFRKTTCRRLADFEIAQRTEALR
jgi:hypothetical protein